MVRTYNIGTECYALITCPNEPEFLLPVKVVLLEKYTQGERTTYKVKTNHSTWKTTILFLTEQDLLIYIISLSSISSITITGNCIN